MIAVQAIRYTTEPLAWHALARALGLHALPGGADDWTEFAGSGILAVHRVASADDARTEINLLADDLDALAADLGSSARRATLDDIGPMLIVDGPPPFTATATSTPFTASASPLSVLPVWYGTDLEAAGRLLEIASFSRRIASDSGGWIDFTATGGGMVALHASPTRSDAELAFEYNGRLEDLAARLSDAGLAPTIVDEAYNRTLRVATPEGPDLWVNGTIDDPYGYTRTD